jgi:transposase
VMESEEMVKCSPMGMGDEVLDEQEAEGILGLRRRGWHVKAIARELGVARNTVRAWLRRGAGSARPRTGRPRTLEGCEAWLRERYLSGVRNGDVLRQELAERGVHVSLRTVERCIKPVRDEAVNVDRASVRFETAPGRQMQVDFGEKWIDIAGERVKAFVFVATLGYSRRSFVRVFAGLRQRHWLSGLDEALRHFGGVPGECLVDNARALVLSWQGDRPIFHPEFEAYCRYWGMAPRACRPYRARTKGKVERSVGYGKSNALGRLSFVSWEALDAHLTWWMREVADVRVHGTTHERPIDRFVQEARALRPIGDHRPYLHVRRFERRVTGDCRIELDTNRYSVPHHLVGRTVEVQLEAGELSVRYRGDVVARHAVAVGRHTVVEDPRHVEGLVRRTALTPTVCELQRPLEEYEAVAGGGAW